MEPGEIVVINDKGVHSIKPFSKPRAARFCVFEYIYFARPDSIVEGTPVYDARKRIGEANWRVKVRRGGRCGGAGPGFRRAGGHGLRRGESGIPFELGIIRNHYVGRTFIEPTDQIRHPRA